MHSHRFDALARGLAHRRSRRTLIGALCGAVGAHIAGGAISNQVSAQSGSVPLGGACFDHHQCANDIDATSRPDLNYSNQLVWCVDNGIWQDGEQNCCRYEGGLCWLDAHCCRDLLCESGYCGGFFG